MRLSVLIAVLASVGAASMSPTLAQPAGDARALQAVRGTAVALRSLDDVAPVIELVGDAHTVLLGESTHGTREFHRVRAAITRELVDARGFDAVVIEAEAAATARASRYAEGQPGDDDAGEALAGFDAFPRWTWRNTEMRDWLQWLRSRNLAVPERRRVALVGFDMQRLRPAIAAVIERVSTLDAHAADELRERYACFGPYAERPERYGRAGVLGLEPRCERPVAEALEAVLRLDPNRNMGTAPSGPNDKAMDERRSVWFEAALNARSIQAAETFYRLGGQSRSQAWNVRVAHMADTIDIVRRDIERKLGRPARIVVWAHNSHVGDARAVARDPASTEVEMSLGQIVRLRAGSEGVRLIGMTTHAGHVTAAAAWGETPQRMALSPSLKGSIERVLHDTGASRFVLRLSAPAVRDALNAPRLHRAVGVVYRPADERNSHHVMTRLPSHYDALVHVDVTQAVEPLAP